MDLTAEDFEKIHTKKVANIIRKLNAGGTLTKRDEEILDHEKMRAAGVAPEKEINFAHTWDELARELTRRLGVSVTRKALQNWRDPKIFPQLAGKWPADRADGRKDVSAWMKFIFETGRHRADEILEDDEVDGDPKTVRDWKMYREELACNEAERRIARGDNLLLAAHELEIPIGSLLAAINSKLSLYPPRTARFMVMKRDVADAEQTLRDEMDAVVKDLNLADYLEPPLEEILSEFPFDDETAALFAKVSFGGQDRTGFLELMRLSVLEVLRRIGQRVLAKSTASDEESNPEKPSAPEEKKAPHSEEQPNASQNKRTTANAQASPQPEHVTRPRKRGGKARAKSTTR